MMRGDRALGIVALAVSAAYYWIATAIPQSRLADAVGAQGLPKAYAIILAALALILIAKSQTPNPKSRSPEPKSQSPKPKAQSPLWRVAGMLGIGIVYILVVPWLGYLLSIAGLIMATTYYQGGAINRVVVLVALGGGVFFWLLFVAMMGIPQPPGWFPPQL